MTAAAAHITVEGLAVHAMRLRVGAIGPWVADIELAEAPAALSGAVGLAIGATTLRGTVVSQQSGSFALHRAARIVGGGAGWGRLLSARGYHNDAGVKARLVAEDAARDAGERLGSFLPGADTVGTDYVRASNVTASTVLEHAAGGAPWWVDYAGATNVGSRAQAEATRGQYTLLSYDPMNRLAQLALDELAAVPIGSVLSDERLGASHVVRDLEVIAQGNDPLRATAWCGALETEHGRLTGLLRALIQRVMSGRLYGVYRYRVVSMSGTRVNLQAVRRNAGLPDVQPVAQWPGVAGVAALLAPGAEVLVSFIEGDPAQPVVTGYGGVGVSGFVPASVVLGGDVGAPAARQGDTVEVLLPPALFSGTITGFGAASGTLNWVLPKAVGVITSGSTKVKVAT
jgi:hypothetical protein